MISSILKTDSTNIHLLGALVTGVSYIAGIGWSGIVNNIVASRFGKKHNFNKFYGFIDEDIKTLIAKLNMVPGFIVDDEAFDVIKAQYDGYEFQLSNTNSTKVYCPWSVLNYLQTGQARPYWVHAAYTEPLEHMFENPEVRKFLCKLLERDETNSCEMVLNICLLDVVEKLQACDLVKLKKHVQGIVTVGTHNLFLNFMLELGYLTVDCSEVITDEQIYVKLPNSEGFQMQPSREK